jgi:hypothetical protein
MSSNCGPVSCAPSISGRAALVAALRELLEVPVTWRPALPANYRTEHRPEGLTIVPGPATASWEWLIGPGTVTVRTRSPEAAPGDVIFTGSAAGLITAKRKEDDGDDDVEYLACELVLLGQDTRNPGNGRYLLLYSREDPTIPRELGLWLAANAEITLDDQIPELRPAAWADRRDLARSRPLTPPAAAGRPPARPSRAGRCSSSS